MAAGAQPVVGCNAEAVPLKEAGNVAFTSGKHLQAYELYSEAILKDPGSALLRANRAGALASLGRHEEAFADAELCCKLQPNWWKGFTRKGHALYHLKRYAESEQSFMEALRLNPGEKSITEGLEKSRAAMGNTAQPGAAAGPRNAAAAATAAPAAPGASVPPVWGVAGAGAGYAAQPGAPAGAAAPVDFQRLSGDDLRSRLEQAAAKLTDQQLDVELKLAGIVAPPGATRADKVTLYTQVPDESKSSGNASSSAKAKSKPAKDEKSEGEKLLEKRKQWLEEWNTWDDDRLVKRLAKLGIDGDGLNRSQLLDELLEVETKRYNERCDPRRMQRYALAGVGVAIVLTFAAVVYGMVAN